MRMAIRVAILHPLQGSTQPDKLDALVHSDVRQDCPREVSEA